LPRPWLAAALVPHVGFTMAQGAWRLLRGRARPFVLGKLDAVRAFPSFRARRRFRLDLARKAVARPHFPMTLPNLADARNHLRRPAESFGRLGGSSNGRGVR
jgi:hypothetical protein